MNILLPNDYLKTKLQTLHFSPRVHAAYDIVMALLSFVIVALLLYQTRSELSESQEILINHVDFVIWFIFLMDYILRLAGAKNKWHFIKTNIIDLISILPLDVAFQGLRTVRILRAFYMFRIFVYLNRLHHRAGKFVKFNDFQYILWFTFSTIFIGAIAISYVDDMNIGDALWWSFVTTTTVGYGDIAPSSIGGRIVAVCLMLIGIGFLSTLTGNISSYFIFQGHHKKETYEETIIHDIQHKLENFNELTTDDIASMNAVLLALKNKKNNP